jgi:hypothetical protein
MMLSSALFAACRLLPMFADIFRILHCRCHYFARTQLMLTLITPDIFAAASAPDIDAAFSRARLPPSSPLRHFISSPPRFD